MIEIAHLHHRFGNRVVLEDLCLAVPDGQCYGILGPNGSGKSTLIHLLATILPVQSGTVKVAGYELPRQADGVRRSIGVVFQTNTLDKKLTVMENLELQGHLYGLRGEALRRRIKELCERLGLTDRPNELVQTLSGGLRRRVELAKALLHQPRVLLLDEACSNLDPAARRSWLDYLFELKEQLQLTVILATHLLDEAERCDQLVLLHRGRIVLQGTPASLKRRVSGDVVMVESAAPAALAETLQTRFGLAPQLVDGMVRVEVPEGHRLVPQLVEAFPGHIQAVHVRKPTLEDVFLRETGVQLC